jgi:hypothetical protein
VFAELLGMPGMGATPLLGATAGAGALCWVFGASSFTKNGMNAVSGTDSEQPEFKQPRARQKQKSGTIFFIETVPWG